MSVDTQHCHEQALKMADRLNKATQSHEPVMLEESLVASASVAPELTDSGPSQSGATRFSASPFVLALLAPLMYFLH